MTSLGLSTGELVALLMIGLGPIRLALVLLGVAGQVEPAARRELARRTVALGSVIAVAVALLAGSLVRKFAPQVESVVIGTGLVLLVSTLAAMVRPASPGQVPTDTAGLRAFALTPLAVPGMVGPVGFALLFAAAAYADGLGEVARFVGLLAVMLALDYAVALLVLRVADAVARPVLIVLQYVLNLLTICLGARMVVEALIAYGVARPR